MKIKLFISAMIIGIIACSSPEKKVKVSDFVDAVNPFVEKIEAFEAKKNLQNFDEFMALTDSVNKEQVIADSVLANLFLTVTDTIYLPFEQVENQNKIEIQKVWVVGVKYNELLIEAKVKAQDNSKMAGPYTSVSAFNKKGVNLAVGGGIGAVADVKLQVDSIYTFSGTIDNLNKLEDFKILKFDEDIKKW